MPGMLRSLITAAAAATALSGAVVPAAVAAEDDSSATQGPAAAMTWSVQPADEDGADGRAAWEFELEPGETVEDVARLNNFGDAPLTFHVYSHDAVNSPDGGFTLQPEDAEPAAVGAWVGLDEEVTVEAGDSVDIPFTLSVPDDATPGDHAGGIVASVTQEATDAQGQRVLVDNRVGSRIYLRVEGEIAPQLEVTGLSVDYERGWIPFSPGTAQVSYEVRNVGNVRLSGEQVINGHGLLGLGEHAGVPDPLKEILPGESVAVAHAIEGVAPLFRLTEEAVVTPQPPAGASAATLPVVQAAAAVTGWAVPWPEALILAAILLWAAWSWWRRRRARRKSKAQIEEAVARAKEEVRLELEQAAARTGGSPASGAEAGHDQEPGGGERPPA